MLYYLLRWSSLWCTGYMVDVRFGSFLFKISLVVSLVIWVRLIWLKDLDVMYNEHLKYFVKRLCSVFFFFLLWKYIGSLTIYNKLNLNIYLSSLFNLSRRKLAGLTADAFHVGIFKDSLLRILNKTHKNVSKSILSHVTSWNNLTVSCRMQSTVSSFHICHVG